MNSVQHQKRFVLQQPVWANVHGDLRGLRGQSKKLKELSRGVVCEITRIVYFKTQIEKNIFSNTVKVKRINPAMVNANRPVSALSSLSKFFVGIGS